MKRFLIPVLIITLFLIVGCNGNAPQQPQAGVPFIGGNTGIDMGLIEGMPPAQVYDGDRMDFAIGLTLENKGEADVGLGTENPFLRAEISGFPPAIFGITAADTVRDYDRVLLGAKKNFDGSILPGGMDRITFDGLRYQSTLQGDFIQNFGINICYDYETFATVPLCFKDDVIENVEDAQICTLTGEKQPQNSGAPIHVTSVVQTPLGPNKIMVNMVLEHVGTGDFYGRGHGDEPWSGGAVGEEETCDPSVTNTNKYRVEVELSPNQGSAMTIDCSGFDDSHPDHGMVTLFGGAPTTLTCTLTDQGSPNRPYVDLLNIKLKYRYGDSIQQPVVIKAIGSRNS